jgi:glycosyltransferase involved in cell wall biosynthesis
VEASLDECHHRLSQVLAGLEFDYELLFVNDGSHDDTLAVLHRLRERDEHVSIIDLSRNFGKEIALNAGLDATDGDAVVVIDADLQDPPERTPVLVAGWRNGADVVYAQRIEQRGESSLTRRTAAGFYRVIRRVSRVEIPRYTGDSRLLSRRAVLALRTFREQHRFKKGIFASIGCRQKAVPYSRDAQFAGRTSFNYWQLWNLALEGITSFTTVPLRVSTYVGSLTATAAFVYGATSWCGRCCSAIRCPAIRR